MGQRDRAACALAIEPVSFGDPKTATYEAWSELGEKLFGYDEAIARQAARDAPVHAMILWRRIERIMRKAPKPLRSTRLAEFEARAAFMIAKSRKGACGAETPAPVVEIVAFALSRTAMPDRRMAVGEADINRCRPVWSSSA